VTFWGVNDGVSWLRNANPLPFDSNDQPKAAFDAILRAATGQK
jgi:GH35 family endo-1,4-beta-xylanase